ncbi:MAG: hypothetical protein AAF502_18000 [Bacteroidota bacterium]
MKGTKIQKNVNSNSQVSKPFFHGEKGEGGFFSKNNGPEHSFFRPSNVQNGPLGHHNLIQLQETEQSYFRAARVNNVTIWFKAFIPSIIPGQTRIIPAGTHAGESAIGPYSSPLGGSPTICYLTDNRSWDNSITASARMTSATSIDLSGTSPRQTNNINGCFPTVELDCLSGNVSCTNTATFRGGGFNLQPSSGHTTPVRLSLAGAANNPCVMGSPDINYNGDITIDQIRRTVSFTGNVDGFPDFEMYVNGNTIFREPHPPGNNPILNLFGAANRRVTGTATF